MFIAEVHCDNPGCQNGAGITRAGDRPSGWCFASVDHDGEGVWHAPVTIINF